MMWIQEINGQIRSTRLPGTGRKPRISEGQKIDLSDGSCSRDHLRGRRSVNRSVQIEAWPHAYKGDKTQPRYEPSRPSHTNTRVRRPFHRTLPDGHLSNMLASVAHDWIVKRERRYVSQFGVALPQNGCFVSEAGTASHRRDGQSARPAPSRFQHLAGSRAPPAAVLSKIAPRP